MMYCWLALHQIATERSVSSERTGPDWEPGTGAALRHRRSGPLPWDTMGIFNGEAYQKWGVGQLIMGIYRDL